MNYTLEMQVFEDTPRPWTIVYQGTANVATIVIDTPFAGDEIKFRFISGTPQEGVLLETNTQ